MPSTLGLESALAFVTAINAMHLFGLWCGYRLLLALYNISPFHPLYRFPGPKLAAASYLYEAWYDLIKVGRYTAEIKAMHRRYLVTAAMALRVLPHLELYDTTYDDVKYDFDALTPQPKKDSRGVRIKGI